ncbi:MAG TPA: ATP-dependent RNA helicase HrpA [Casimicrobiaceae bacterium]|nr:ATP-dependent RNA helicase HrpA [Casimicrobiaceae bacterium]
MRARLDGVMSADAPRLARRIAQAQSRRAGASDWARIESDIERSAARVAARRAGKPAIDYPAELPVAQRADEIAAAIRAHRVVVVSGETGSGKTTQLPKICLAAGRGERGLIGHTQPRRIAARAVAARIAQELGAQVGDAVGYKVRFTDHTRPDAYVKLMTDGILLAETQGDRALAAYDTIIVDEAHERSLNIDFLLGYLRRLVEQRDDLRVVITSATIDAERFARHFDTGGRTAPVIEVSGRLYPVDVRYRALGSGDDDEADDEEPLEEAIVNAAEELWREGPGDILAFLPGEREIRETGDLARRALARRPYADAVEILPLYARLSVAEQQRVFGASRGRRLVLATNVAETSLTVPGIRYVIDSGLARIKRYSVRNKTTLLQIEKISQAAARQRAGRSGRVQHGIAVRLFSEDDFESRPPYTEPEILRSSLAGVILRMAALDLGEVGQFPFLDPPAPRAIADGYQLLQELDAVDERNALTARGRELARLPLDPRVGRMVQSARDEHCLAEVLVIASALSVPDPRERPLDKRAAADQAHLRFRDERSDFLSLLALWEFFVEALAQKLSHRRLVEHARAHFVSFLRLTEWRDVHQQLVATLNEAGWKWDERLPKDIDAARYAAIHRALLAGLLGNIGLKDEDGDYLGARGIRFRLHPGSGLAKKGPKWVLAAELTETTRLFARCAARIEPEWVETVAADRVSRDYFEPHWDAKRGEVVASERVSLYGLPLVPRRPVSFGRIDPAAAREVFLREALVPGALETSGAFLAHNRALIEDVAKLEHKTRRQDVLVDEQVLAALYAERVPPHVHSRATFEAWRKEAEANDPQLLFFTRDDVMRHGAAHVTEALFPTSLALDGTRLALDYRFAPGHPRDGLTLTVPLALLNQVDEDRLSWLVPGLVRDKVTLYLKALPKALRNRLIPLPDTVTAFLEASPFGQESLAQALRGYLRRRLGEAPAADAFDAVELPPYLVMNLRVVDAAGAELGEGRDLADLRRRLGEAAQMSFAAAGPGFERSHLRSWEFGELPESLTIARKGQRVTGYPALVDEGEDVALRLLDTRDAAEASTRAGVIRLIRFQLKDVLVRYEKGLPGFQPIALQLRAAIAPDRLLGDVVEAIVDRAFIGDDPLPRDASAFAAQVKRARARLPAVAEAAMRSLGSIATAYGSLTQKLNAAPVGLGRLVADLRTQRDALVHPRFFAATPWAQLAHLPRYLQAFERRLAKYSANPDRDARHAAQVAAWFGRYRERLERDQAAGRVTPGLEDFRWLLEELKVSLFAQELRTPTPVSFKRVERAWNALER